MLSTFFVCACCRQYFGIEKYKDCPSGSFCDYCNDFTGRPKYKPAVNIGQQIEHLSERHPFVTMSICFALFVIGCAVTGS